VKYGEFQSFDSYPDSFLWVHWGPIGVEKVFLRTSLERNLPNSSYIFLLDVNFENLTIGLYVFIISSILGKFQEDQILMAMSSIKILNFKFW